MVAEKLHRIANCGCVGGGGTRWHVFKVNVSVVSRDKEVAVAKSRSNRITAGNVDVDGAGDVVDGGDGRVDCERGRW